MSTRRSPEVAALKPAYKGRWLAFGLDLICPVLVGCESPIAQVSDYSVQRLAAHEKYENSLVTTTYKELSYKDYLIIQQVNYQNS